MHAHNARDLLAHVRALIAAGGPPSRNRAFSAYEGREHARAIRLWRHLTDVARALSRAAAEGGFVRAQRLVTAQGARVMAVEYVQGGVRRTSILSEDEAALVEEDPAVRAAYPGGLLAGPRAATGCLSLPSKGQTDASGPDERIE